MKFDLERYEEAVADNDEAIRLDPKYVEAYSNRGVAKSVLGRYQEAIADYDEAIRLDPKCVSAYVGRGMAKVEQGRFKEAIADYNEAIRLDPKYELARWHLFIAQLWQAGDGLMGSNLF